MSEWEALLGYLIMVVMCGGVFGFMLFGMYSSLDKWSRGE
jgi:hypothetical protein